MATSPTSRTTKLLRDTGWTYQIVEYWCPHSRRRKDLWGIGDILVMDKQPGSLLLQVSSASGHAARVKKSLAEPRLEEWLESGNRFEVWTWGKKGARGKRKLWTVRKDPITLERWRDEQV